ncbi:hypothetical protein PCE1_000516 [Barthelona sp. PCE]
MIFKAQFLAILMLFISVGFAQQTIKAHLIAHTHNDPGWLRSLNEYYNSETKPILNSIVSALKKDPKRKFNWNPAVFLEKYWNDLNAHQKEEFRTLVQEKRFCIGGGGWVANDEATVDLQGIVTQYTNGHTWLKDTFDIVPKSAWQIDSFGHSSFMPSVLSHMNIPFMVGNRIDFRVRDRLKELGSMEFIWEGNDLLGKKSRIVIHLLYHHYSSPDGFDFEKGWHTVTDSNVRNMAHNLVEEIKRRKAKYPTDNVLIVAGEDFRYKHAEKQFDNWDKLIKYINSNKKEYNVEIGWSSLEEYYKAIVDSKDKLPVVSYDFMPYISSDDFIWTGYYTTAPRLKGVMREVQGALRTTEHAATVALMKGHKSMHDSFMKDIVNTRNQVGLVQHHDAATGTARKHVRDDYVHRLGDSVKKTEQVSREAVSALFKGFKVHNKNDKNTCEHGMMCPVVVQNPMGWKRKNVVSIKVEADKKFKVTTETGVKVSSQFCLGPDNCYVEFVAEVVGFGFRTYFLQQDSDTTTLNLSEVPNKSSFKVETEDMVVHFGNHGFIRSVENKHLNKAIDLGMTYMEYSTHRSGAYLFRPTGEPHDHHELGNLHSMKHVETENLHIVKLDRSSLKTEFRIPKRGFAIRVHTTLSAGSNKEVIIKFKTDINTQNNFHTDNGVSLKERVCTKQSGLYISSQYFPSTTQTSIYGDRNGLVLGFRQPHGVSHRHKGEVEVMLHRNLRQDDSLGLAEGHRDQSTVTLKMLVQPVWTRKEQVVKPAMSYFDESMDVFDMRSALLFNNPMRAHPSSDAFPSFEAYHQSHPFSLSPIDVSGISPNLHIFSFDIFKKGDNPQIALRVRNIAHNKGGTATLSIKNMVTPLGKIKALKEVGLNLVSDREGDVNGYVLPESDGYLQIPSGIKSGSRGSIKHHKKDINHPAPDAMPVSNGEVSIAPQDLRAFIITVEPHFSGKPDTGIGGITPEPTHPVQPTEPTQPTHPVQPTEPTQPTEPSHPEPTQPMTGDVLVHIPPHPSLKQEVTGQTKGMITADMIIATLLSVGAMLALSLMFVLFRTSAQHSKKQEKFTL